MPTQTARRCRDERAERDDDRSNRRSREPVLCHGPTGRFSVWDWIADPIWASGCVPRQSGRTHDRNRPARQISHFSLASKGPFSNRVSLVNSLLLSSVAAPGSRFSPRSEGSAATSGSKYKRCNVHNGLAWCRYVAQGPPAQPPAPSPRWATITPEATLRMDLSEGPVRRPPADRTSGMARPSARCCA